MSAICQRSLSSSSICFLIASAVSLYPSAVATLLATKYTSFSIMIVLSSPNSLLLNSVVTWFIVYPLAHPHQCLLQLIGTPAILVFCMSPPILHKSLSDYMQGNLHILLFLANIMCLLFCL